jgi:arylsulfatase A-like enzyme
MVLQMPDRRIRKWVALLVIASIAALGGTANTAHSAEDEPAARPNIIVINTDDQRPETLSDMPKLRSWMADGGTAFPNAYVSTPSCCPSRATLMSGRYVHNNRQYQHLAQGFDLNLTTQRYLRDGGYFTGHSGKFLHWLPLSTRPPHWDRWTYFKGGYDNVAMNWDGKHVKTSGYSTVITFDRAINYLNDFESRDDAKPFYLHLTPVAPHGPTTPEAKFASAPVSAMNQVPSQTETNRSDKPPFVRNKTTSLSTSRTVRTAQVRTLLTVDEQVDRLMRHLETTGELENTIVIYTSDNGYFWSEHLLKGKFLPYKEAVNVPFLVRWPGKVAAGAVDTRQVTHVDVLPTLLAAAGLTQSSVALDGRDILSGLSRDAAFMEYYYDTGNNNGIPTWASIRTAGYQFTEYYGANNGMSTVTFREYYDLVNDPYQLVNLLNDGVASNDPANLTQLSAQLARAKTCVGANCP